MILLKNCFYIFTSDDDRSFEGFDILIKKNRIEKIAKDIDQDKKYIGGYRVIDCSKIVVVPGFVNTHHHFYQVLTRNVPAVQNAKLFDWLAYLYEVWKNIDEEAVFYSSMAAIGELLKTGCTCTTDHHYLYPAGFKGDLMGIQFDAAKKLGMRFSPCRGSMSRSRKDGGLPPDSVVQTEGEILEDSLRVIEKYHDSSDFSMARVMLAPCSPFSVTEGLLKRSAGLARDHGVRLHTHLAETADEDDYCVKNHNTRPLGLMSDLDFIGEDVSYAHGIFFNDDEIKMLADTRTSIAHCPSSNMRLGSGIARVREMLDTGVNVAIGVDGSASNDTSDFLGEMRNALLLQRVRYGADALTARDVYKMATQNGAKLLGFKRTGRVREGWAADLALFNIDKLEYAGALSDPSSALLFAGINHQSEYTIVNGRIVVEKGRVTGFDEDEIKRNVNRISRGVLKKDFPDIT
jgi:cytosine/adenosine deaminase-related metal-dependent hydrolase